MPTHVFFPPALGVDALGVIRQALRLEADMRRIEQPSNLAESGFGMTVAALRVIDRA
jgi:hypothetical protein